MATSVINNHQKEELESILHSGIFAKAPRQTKLLEHICNEYFSGRADQIKEYNLAIEVLGKAVDFDQNRDAIVRVEFHRLRKKLREYYQGEGAARAFRIVIDPGHYVPRFVPREEAFLVPPDADLETSEIRENRRPERLHWLREKLAAYAQSGGRRVMLMLLAGFLLAGVMAVVLLRWVKYQPVSTQASAFASQSRLASPAVAAGSLDSVRIICGYSKRDYVDSEGKTWGPDRYYTGGTVRVEPHQFIARAADNTLFETAREGEFSYDIPLKAGIYELHLYFVETDYGPGTTRGGGEISRLFQIDLNGNHLLTDFDIFSDADGTNVADERVFKDIAPASDGKLHLKFTGGINTPILSALEVVPGLRGKMLPVRIVAQEHSYTDQEGRLWGPDRYFSSGRLAAYVSPVEGTSDSGLYSSYRFGHFDYAIPVPDGRYAVTLYFAETYLALVTRGSPAWGRDFSMCTATAPRCCAILIFSKRPAQRIAP